MQEKSFSFITTKYKVINIKNKKKKKYKIVKKKKSKNCKKNVCMFVLLFQTHCTLFAYAQMNMLIHDFSRCILGVGHCACCSVSLLFVGSANWMPARNVALPIDIGHCDMHSVHKNHRPQNLAS